MNDRFTFRHYFDQHGPLAVLRGPQPSSTTRLDIWARALLNAYDNRAHVVKIIDERGSRIRRPEIDFTTLLAKIERQLEREKARGGQQEGVLSALNNVFGAQDACGTASMRNHLIDLAYAGTINPDEAETWAHRLGLRQIAKRNGRDLCSPMQEAEWSLLMAAVWIHCRDLRHVARVSTNSEDFLPRWVKIEHEGGSTGYDLDPCDDLEGVKGELLQYLRSGSSRASGSRDGERREIAPVEWSDLQIVGRYEREGFSTVMSQHGERDIYERIRLSRDDLLVVFPPLTDDESATQLLASKGMVNGSSVACVTANKRQRRTKSVVIAEYMRGQFSHDPSKSVPEWRRFFRLHSMNEYEAADEDTIAKARNLAWPPK